jgi:hypothetical protein
VNIDATEADLFAITEVLKLAAILDDRAPRADKARIAAWAEKVHQHRLQRGELLDGLQAFYDEPRDRAIGIGDLLSHARRIKRDRLDREAEPEREHRQETFDAKAADEIHSVADGFITGPVENPTDRLVKAEIGLQCCNGKQESQAAIREFFAAKAEALKVTA